MDIWMLTTFFLLAVTVILTWSLKNEENRVKRYQKRADQLEAVLTNEGANTCCLCGKSYFALNDPDYSPELNICRDCMWKMYYGQTFGEEDV